MSKRVWSGVLASIFCGTVAVAAAQDPQTPQSGAASGKSMTVSGCIQKAEPSAGATGTAGTTSASDTKFVLKNVSSAGAAGTSGTAGTAGSASASGATASEYRLDADDAKLSPHVGHKVEITGTVDKSASGASSSAASAAASPKLKVESVKMVSATCP
jgi:hypothetical protein